MAVLQRIWQAWKRFGQAIGDFIGRLVLTIFYFTLFAPFGIGVRLLADPLDLKQSPKPSWLARSTRDKNLDDGRKLS